MSDKDIIGHGPDDKDIINHKLDDVNIVDLKIIKTLTGQGDRRYVRSMPIFHLNQNGGHIDIMK